MQDIVSKCKSLTQVAAHACNSFPECHAYSVFCIFLPRRFSSERETARSLPSGERRNYKLTIEPQYLELS